MKAIYSSFAVCLLLISPVLTEAQTRNRRSTSSQRRRPAATSPTLIDQTRFNAQRLELATVSKDLTRFLYLYGRLSKDLELTGAQAESSDAVSRTRAGLVQSIGDMRDRLDRLERQFRFTQGLEAQYQTLRGVSASADQAAQQASAGRFDQAGRILLEVANKLTDTLLEM